MAAWACSTESCVHEEQWPNAEPKRPSGRIIPGGFVRCGHRPAMCDQPRIGLQLQPGIVMLQAGRLVDMIVSHPPRRRHRVEYVLGSGSSWLPVVRVAVWRIDNSERYRCKDPADGPHSRGASSHRTSHRDGVRVVPPVCAGSGRCSSPQTA